jgi:Fibronectin type III domain
VGRWDNPGEPARPGSEPPPVPGGADEPPPAPGLAFFALPASAAAAPGAALPDGAAPHPARRGRGRWVALVALVVLVGLAGGLLVWAPWQRPPLLRPAGLTAGPATASSVAFHWSGPATGPLPDKYLILYGGSVIGSVPGKVTSYTRTGLYPDTSYAYRVAAVRGGSRSAPSAVVVLKTATPPLSAARWQGQWTVHVKVVRGGAALTGPRPLRWDESWQVSPRCVAGPCAVRVHGSFNGTPSGQPWPGGVPPTAGPRWPTRSGAGRATAGRFACRRH